MPYFTLEKSKQKNKKYKVVVYDHNKKKLKTIHFGDSRYEDFTTHKDEERKKRYIQRHKPKQDWEDYTTAGFWSKHLLWNRPTIKESIKDIMKRFNIRYVSKME